MATTESEAKQKWCPFSRAGVLAGADGVAVNRHVSDDSRNEKDRLVERETRCIASACMAWRWEVNWTGKPSEAWNGYCGLAGTP